MKAHIREIPMDKIVVRDVELEFNSFDENHIQHEGEVEQRIEEKHPGALDLLNMKTDLAGVDNGLELAKKYGDAKDACRDFFDDMFGAGTGEKLLGKDPNFGQAIEVYSEFKAELARQGMAFGQRIAGTLTQHTPVGPSGSKQGVQ